MRYLRGFLFVYAIGLVSLVGCGPEPGVMLCQGITCDDDGNECTEDICNPADGNCGVPLEDGTACSDGACLNGVCTALATVSGTVDVIDVEPPGEVSATVSWLGTSLSTTTDELGRFSLDVPIGYGFSRSWKEGHWGWIDGWPVSRDGVTDIEIPLISDALMAQSGQELMRDIDETKGIVFAYFDPASALLGGESVTLSGPYDFAFTEDATGNLVISDELLPGGEAWLQFVGVDVTDELTVLPKGVDGESTCRLADCWRDVCVAVAPSTAFPVEARFLTAFDVECALVP